MAYFVFKPIPGIGRAITDDPAGARLPALPAGVWALEKGAPHIVPEGGQYLGAKCGDIINTIQANGYYIWPSIAGPEQTAPGPSADVSLPAILEEPTGESIALPVDAAKKTAVRKPAAAKVKAKTASSPRPKVKRVAEHQTSASI